MIIAIVFAFSGCLAEHPTASMADPIDLAAKETGPAMGLNEMAYSIEDLLCESSEEHIKQILDQSQGILTLKQAVALAAKYSHPYQTRREEFYIQTRNKSLIRSHVLSQFPRLTHDIDWPGMPSTLQPFADARTDMAGAKTTTELADAWAAVLTGPWDVASVSRLQAHIGDPMPKHVQTDPRSEPAIQNQRDQVALIRSFQRFHLSFHVSILNQYYQILHLQEAAELTEQKLTTLQDAYKQMENLAKVGYAKPHELDRALQDQLRAQDDRIKAKKKYQDALDEFKLLIGIPVHMHFQLDKNELAVLQKESLKEPNLSLRQGIEIALLQRLDLMNQKDKVADRARDVLRKAYDPVARREFVTASGTPWPNDTEVGVLQYVLHKCNYRLDTYITLDQTMDHNAFQRDIVQLAQERRQYKHAAETIKKQVRKAHRRLTRSKHRYEVQQKALELARKRIVNTSKLLQNGRASIQDVLRAREDEFDAKIDATEALVSHGIATLDFYRDCGLLKINPDGRWEIMTPEQ